MVVLGVAVPLLDSAGGERGPVIETEHHATCVRGHDHTICTQMGSNLQLPAEADADERPRQGVTTDFRSAVREAASAPLARRHPPRAPPTV